MSVVSKGSFVRGRDIPVTIAVFMVLPVALVKRSAPDILHDSQSSQRGRRRNWNEIHQIVQDGSVLNDKGETKLEERKGRGFGGQLEYNQRGKEKVSFNNALEGASKVYL